MVRALDEVSKFEEFRHDILPKLQRMLKDGKSAADLRAFAQAYLTARQITEALTNPDAAVALRAIDSLTHQNEGKPKERQEVEHKFEKLKPEELDSMILAKLAHQESGEEKTEETH